MQIVVVESPAKAKTINKYLGPGYKVIASFGHVRDLPPKDGSVRPDDDFDMDWEVDNRAEGRLKEIAQAVKSADKLFLATDPDREGEAISWHIEQELRRRRFGAVVRLEVAATMPDQVVRRLQRELEVDDDALVTVEGPLSLADLMSLVSALDRPELVRALVLLGASPRSMLALTHTAQARAIAEGRSYVLPDDVKALAPNVLAHRLILKAHGGTGVGRAVELVRSVLDQVPVPLGIPERS